MNMTKQSKRGIWQLWVFKDGEPHRVIAGTDPSVHTIHNSTNDCDGDVLFDYMTEHGIVESWDEYETDGDLESVAVIHKTGAKPDYSWTFVEYAPPSMPSDDCHSFS